MTRFLAVLALCATLFALLLTPSSAQAEAADIEASSRGVVRIVIIGRDGDEIFPVSHGSGFAVGPETILTNAHVVAEAKLDDSLAIGIVPSDGTDAVYGRIVAISMRNDLALIRTTEAMNLPPLTFSGNPPTTSGSVFSIGYPMNVDRAQGLNNDDVFRAQPPVTSQGFLSGRRPSREMDTLLHTAPIARGNSGGPLVDECGRVIGVNSFGAESGGTDAEFFFAVSTREILPFLRANNVTPQLNALPCRSIADLEADEIARAERAQRAAEAKSAAEEAALARRSEEARRSIEFALMSERENRMALTFLFLVIALGAGAFAYTAHERGQMRPRSIAGSIALVAVIGALVAWLSRPQYSEIEDRLETQLREEQDAPDSGTIARPVAAMGKMTCVLDSERSRVTGQPVTDLPFEFDAAGCVNGRTQYGEASGRWQRVFVPGSEAAVSVNTFDPEDREYVVERYLLDRSAMTEARTARANYDAPSCGGDADAARTLGSQQGAVLSLLPQRPNERLVYRCAAVVAKDPENQN